MKQFDSVPVKVPAKNVFTLDHDVKASYNFDKLYPFLCHPVYPGDTFNCRAEVFLRCFPLQAPVMHNVDLRMYFFFVPNRLLWNENRKSNWKTFITGGEKGDYGEYGYADDPAEVPVLPHIKLGDMAALGARLVHGSLWDHMGFPTADTSTFTMSDTAKSERVCSLPFRAYQMIWNEYFRNQNVQDEVEFSYDEGAETVTNINKLLAFRYKNWEKDYFTSCLPFAQRGQAMLLPISRNNAEDVEIEAELSTMIDTIQAYGDSTTNSAMTMHSSGGNRTFLSSKKDSGEFFLDGDDVQLKGLASGTISIDAAELSFTGLQIGTINDFRYCLRLQQWLENNARCGSRYIEQLFAHFGVVSSDARLQRPELLGGGKVPLLFTDVEQTSYGDTAENSGSNANVLGNLGGKGSLYGKSAGFKKYFEEHGILMGILCIIPRTSYSQGIPRYWSAFDKTDWYFPEFAHLGEQAVLNKEVYFDLKKKPVGMADDEPNGVFGYQGRFTELRYIPSSVHGEMRDSLSYWHLGRFFGVEPSLNSDFVTANTRANIFSFEDIRNSGYDPFVAQIHLDISAVRPLPKYAVPTL